jgi:hypothetical protein
MTTTEASPPFVSIHTLTNRFEADLLMDALMREGIPTMLRNFEETPYNGLFVSQKGWGLLMVPEAQAEAGRQVIQPFLKTVQEGSPYVAPSEIDPHLWERLRSAHPHTVCGHARVNWNKDERVYELPFLNIPIVCSPQDETIEAREKDPCLRVDFELYLATLHYLLEAERVEPTGIWISEKDLPSGAFFFRGPHVFPFAPLLEQFGTAPELFEAAGRLLGGSPVDMGDVAFQLNPYPRVPLLFVLWEGDEEFEAAMHIRFDETVLRHITTLDTLWALVNVVCRSLRLAGARLSEEARA